ncbi:MAG: SOS response-associated peptidase [Desulfobacterales bacterium]|nr:SOS response-associated peptidase [Desulfobacterales bacterium]
MCGRFVAFSAIDEIQKHFGVDQLRAEQVQPSYNVAPTQQIAVVRRDGDERVMETMHWGLVPFWAKDPSIGSRMINARIETVAGKPSFKAAFKKRRCLIVNDGFFEWTGSKGNRQPLFIKPEGEAGPFAFAGLWEVWRAKEAPEAAPLLSCTILTMDASESIRQIHHRMPVMLKPDSYALWIDPVEIAPGDLKTMVIYRDFETVPVSQAVNSPENNNSSLLDPLLM